MLPLVDASNCTAHGDGLTKAIVGREAAFVAEAKGWQSEPVEGYAFTVGITGPAKVSVSARAPKTAADGKSPVTYTPTAAGEHVIAVQADGAHIKSSPFKLTVLPAVDASKTTVSVAPAKPTAGNPVRFIVHTNDADNKPLGYGGEKVTLAVLLPDGKRAEVPLTDKSDGTYTGELVPTQTGAHTATPAVADKQGVAAPFEVKPAVDSSRCVAQGDGLHNATVGKPAQFNVTTNDHTGKPVDGVAFNVEITGPAKVTPDQKKTSTGKSDVTYTPAVAGAYAVAVTIDGAHIKDSPFKLAVLPALDAGKTETTTDPATPVTGQPAMVRMQLKDADGKPLTSSPGVEVTLIVKGPNGEEIKVPLKVRTRTHVQYIHACTYTHIL